MNKVILLDIDGVIAPTYSIAEDFHLIDIQWTRFIIPNNIAKFIEDISNKVDTIWISSWEEDSYKVSEKLKLNIHRHITFPNSTEKTWFKVNELKCLIEENQDKLIMIIDDEICEFVEHFKHYNNLTIICPDDRIGLSYEDMLEIKQWIN